MKIAAMPMLPPRLHKRHSIIFALPWCPNGWTYYQVYAQVARTAYDALHSDEVDAEVGQFLGVIIRPLAHRDPAPRSPALWRMSTGLRPDGSRSYRPIPPCRISPLLAGRRGDPGWSPTRDEVPNTVGGIAFDGTGPGSPASVKILWRSVTGAEAGLGDQAVHLWGQDRDQSARLRRVAYLMTLRIERAMALLHHGDLSATEVRSAAGCSSLGTFSSRFIEPVGVPPGVHRRHAAGGGRRAAGATAGCHPAWPNRCQTDQESRSAGHRAAPTMTAIAITIHRTFLPQ